MIMRMNPAHDVQNPPGQVTPASKPADDEQQELARMKEVLRTTPGMHGTFDGVGKPAEGGVVDAVLARLDALDDDAAVHIWPDDLEKCMTSECVVEVASVRMGSPDGKTVPLFSRAQVAEAVRTALAREAK